MRKRTHSFALAQSGFTLLELVVVIAVMAVLSTVALRSLKGVASQSRFEATQRGLEQIRDAILGSPQDRQPNGAWVSSGFVADTGRLPRSLDELISQPADLSSYSVGWSDAGVLVAGGWRGPYVRLSSGATNLCDGWASAYVVTNDSNGYVQAVVSFGADGLPGGDDVYDSDLALCIAPTDYQSSLVGQVTLETTTNAVSGSFYVTAYGPGTNRVQAASRAFAVSAYGSVVSDYEPFKETLSSGPRAIRATAVCTMLGAASTNVTVFSAVAYLNVRPGYNIQNLTLRLP